MDAFKQVVSNFLGSEKAIAAGVLVVLATVFVFTGKMNMTEWKEFTLWCLGIYTSGKTLHGVATLIAPGAATPQTDPPGDEEDRARTKDTH